MAILATLVLLGGVAATWLITRRVTKHRVGLPFTALLAVVAIALALLEQRRAWVPGLAYWRDWVYFARVPLWLAITVLLALAWWQAAGLRRRSIGLLTGVFLAYATAEVAAPALLPLFAAQLSAETMGTGPNAAEALQSTGWSCGPTALAWTLRLRGLQASEREMALLSATVPLSGTSWPGMFRAAHHRGLTATILYPVTWEKLQAAPKPLLADWRLNAVISHMIVVIAATPETVTVGDPLGGESTCHKTELLGHRQKRMMALGESTSGPRSQASRATGR